MEADTKDGLAGRAGSAISQKIRTCGEWLCEVKRQADRGKLTLAIGALKCIQMEIEELGTMLGHPSPNASGSATPEDAR